MDHPASIPPVETASNISNGGTKALGSKYLILIFPPETLLTSSCKRTPKVPICANEPGKVLAIFHLTFFSDVVPSELCSD